MRSEQRSITLNIYLESNHAQEPVTRNNSRAESPVPALTFPNVSNPEWAAHVLRRTMYIQSVIDSGPSKNDSDQYEISVVYQHEQVSDVSSFMSMVRLVLQNAGVSTPHL